tara:strand:- start:1837 stop:2427 length:591 start_codon:yes stop_codon:yes gene_type:complete
MNLSDNLAVEYGNTAWEQLSNILFETKEKLDNKNYTIICELLVKVDKMLDHPLTKLHSYHFKLVTPIYTATDTIKEQLDYTHDNYNSDFELEHDDEEEDDIQFIESESYCKIYLKEDTESLMVFDSIKEMKNIIRNSMKNPKSCKNYESSLSVLFTKHSNEIHQSLKNHIDIEWTKIGKTLIVPTLIKPWVQDELS